MRRRSKRSSRRAKTPGSSVEPPDEQHVVDVLDAAARPSSKHRVEARVEPAVEAVRLEELAELRAGEGLQRASPGARASRSGRSRAA